MLGISFSFWGMRLGKGPTVFPGSCRTRSPVRVSRSKKQLFEALETIHNGGPVMSPGEYLEVLLELGSVQQLLGEYEASVQIYRQVMTDEMLSEKNSPEFLSNPLHRNLCLQLALTYDQKGEYEQALRYLNLLESHIPNTGDLEHVLERARTIWATSRVYFHQEQNTQALALCNMAQAILTRLPWSEVVGGVQVSIYHTMAQCGFNLGNYETAFSQYQQALEMARRLNQQAIIPRLLIGLGNVARRWGDYQGGGVCTRELGTVPKNRAGFRDCLVSRYPAQCGL
jgi:tetratricopeptide (TPR) repeat protein